ncbi:MAG TPA: hypothetical protein VFX97_14135 [Pyrinomonadaceae bacterium]|nr:hypothetical protein [Pyrinomonadaceae bacterium]
MRGIATTGSRPRLSAFYCAFSRRSEGQFDKRCGYVYTIVGVMFGAGFGALGGLLWGSAKQKQVLIYEAP